MRVLVPSGALIVMLPLAGCDGVTAPSGPPVAPASTTIEAKAEVDTGPTEIELKDAKAEWRDAAVVKFEIPYRFTSGSPRMVYQCRIEFPNEKSGGIKPMEAWELKQEGVIRTGIPVNGKVVKEFTVAVYEAEAHDKPYHLVSNLVKGEVPGQSSAEAPTDRVPATSPK